MRTTATAALGAALLLSLTACGNNHSDSNADKPHPTPTVSKADRYLKTAHTLTFTGSGPTDSELLDYPPKWCDGLDAGHSVSWLFSGGGGGLYPIGMDWGTKKREANQLLVAGVRVYCPQHTDAVTAELRASGDY
jgi:hypothetical protein